MLSKVIDMCKETGANISEKFIHRTHRLGNSYAYNKKKQVSRKKSCKKIIMRFTTFCYRTSTSSIKSDRKTLQLNYFCKQTYSKYRIG